MNKNNQKLTTRGQTLIELACIGGAALIWVILLLLGGLTEVFFFVLLAYHIIGGLINRDLAKSTVAAILLAPVYVGKKVALYIQHIIVDDNLNDLTTDELVDINHAILDIINKHPNKKNENMTSVLFGCVTYGELEEFNQRIIQEYNKRKKQTDEKTKNTQNQSIQKNVNKTANTQTKSVNNTAEKITDAEKQKLQKMGKLDVAITAYNKAINGDSQAMMFMGMIYNLDLEIPQKAFYWMDKATKKGNDQAEYFLGTYYADGYGVEKNRTKGVSIILSSASKGNKDAIDCCMNKMEMSIEEMRNCGIPV